MLHLTNKPLPGATSEKLQEYQNEVDAQPTFTAKVAEGKRLFSARNKSSNPVFREIRATLASMSGDTIRCHYCEDSHANQVEHIYPKKHYPDKCFRWGNYAYACGPCNQPKSDRFALFEDSTGREIPLERDRKSPPPLGMALLIDPRVEQPMDYLFLDTIDTFHFVPYKENPKDKRRAEYTIDILGLNSRTYLVKARRVAFQNYKSRLFEYVNKKGAGASPADLLPLEESLKKEHHPTVWFEMIRQRRLHPEIDDLLRRAPETLAWR